THEKVIKNKDKFSGCTVHYVTGNLDSGKKIIQKKIRVTRKDNKTSLAKKILKQEHKLYPAAIKKIFN
ncbi:formyltransferase family protein, partial [Candidatus Pelagibacter sp.]|nr:formyltransferase family protein [Candidatus Pelagibacter sp.]